MIYNFREIKLTSREGYTCSSCGNKRWKVVSASQTVNPYNRHPDGTTKTAGEVHQSVSEELNRLVEKFRQTTHVCAKCKGV